MPPGMDVYLPSVTPATHVRIVLGYHRCNGSDFEAAWISALRSLPKGTNGGERAYMRQWKLALRWAKPSFRAAFEGDPMPVDMAPLERAAELDRMIA